MCHILYKTRIFFCVPISASWDHNPNKVSCSNTKLVWYLFIHCTYFLFQTLTVNSERPKSEQR